MTNRQRWHDYPSVRLESMYDAYASLACDHRKRGSWGLASYCRSMQVAIAVELSLRYQDQVDQEARQLSLEDF